MSDAPPALPLDSLRHPDFPSAALTLEGTTLMAGARAVATWVPSARRLEWQIRLDDELTERVALEREKFDREADGQRPYLQREVDGGWTESHWLHRKEMEQVLERHAGAADVSGLRILDVGGTCPIAWRFLAAGASHVHHVDVSPRTQDVAYERCRLHDVADHRLLFHTAAAERLPLADASVDVVFSRHSTHHLMRPAAFDEFRRVLVPKGRLVLFEPWLAPVLRRVMLLRRWAMSVDRGTDDPFGKTDIAELESRFDLVDYGLFGFGSVLAFRALGRLRPLHPALGWLERYEHSRGTLPLFGRSMATHVWIVAHR